MRELSEAELIEIEQRARTLAALAQDVNNPRLKLSREDFEDLTADIEDAVEATLHDVADLCARLRRPTIQERAA